MVGRHNCLMELSNMLESSKLNNTCIAGVIGPAGIGKSTLVENFLALNKDELKVIQIECNPSLVNSPYSLIYSLLMSIMNINNGESVLVKQSRIISYISFLLSKYDEESVKRNYQFISFLMGIEVDKETRDIISSMDTKSIYREVARQLSLLFHEFENRFRTLILIEDMHWADSKSVTLLKEIWSSCIAGKNGKNIYIYTSRNTLENLKELPQNSHHIINLKPLEIPTVIEYIKLYVGCEEVDDSFANYIYSFSGGNPLYMHELLRYIKKITMYYIDKDKVFLQKSMDKVPDSLQGLILSKLNYMSQRATEIAQASSIIGKDFSVAVLSKLLHTDVEEEEFLKEAIDSNIIYLKSTYTYGGRIEKLYSFAHETEREAIYNSILHKKKIDYHRDTGRAIETLYSRNIESYYEVLGGHFEKGAELSKASDYYANAAQHYKNLFNTQDALSYFIKAYDCLTKLKQADKEKLYPLCVAIGELYGILSDFKNAKSFLNKALKLSGNINDRWSVELGLARIYKEQSKYKDAMDILNAIQEQMNQNHKLYGSLLFLKCNIQRVIGQSQQALTNIKKAENILLKNKDYNNLAKVLNAAGAIYHTTSDIDNALKLYLKSYKYCEKTGDLLTLMKCAGNMATIFHIQGDLNSATKYFNTAMDLSKKISHLQSYVTNSNNFGILYLDKGMFTKAKALFEEAAKIAKDTSTLFMQSASLSNLADIEYYIGDYKTAKRYAAQALEISKDIDDIEGEGINNISLAKISIEQHLLQDAKKYLEVANRIYSEIDIEDGWSDYHYYLAQYYLELNEYDKALEPAQKSYELAYKCQNNRKQAKAVRLQGIILQKKGEFVPSISHFDTSVELLEKEEASYELAKSLYLRAISYSKLNKNEAAQKDLKAAHANIKKIDKCKWTKIIEHGIA